MLSPRTSSLGGGLRRNYLSFPEVVAQSVGTIAPSGTPGLVIPVVFATAGNGTWLAYLFAMIALLIVGLQINVLARRAQGLPALVSGPMSASSVRLSASKPVDITLVDSPY